jgi:hypothetical protein
MRMHRAYYNAEGKENSVKNIWSNISQVCSLSAVVAVIVVAVAFSVASLLTDEPWRANFAFALLVMSVFGDLAIVTSYGNSTKVKRIARAMWCLVAVACLSFAQYVVALPHPEAAKNANTVLAYALFILAFPSGLIATVFAFAYAWLVSPSHGATPFDLVVSWLIFVFFGYFQWFKLFPFLITKWQERKGNSLNDSKEFGK